MDLCQKNETELENSGNNEIQSTEETELTYPCPDGRRERDHVCCLLNISDILLEQDRKANEFVIGTGWEEAVQGWGRTSATACIWPRKKLKKVKVGESTSNCIFCVSLSQGICESKPQSEAVKLVSGALAEADPEKDQGSPSQTQSPAKGHTTASRGISKTCFPSYSRVEKKSLQIKEFIWCMEEWGIPKTVRGKDPSRGTDRGTSTSHSLTSKALLVLPPLKASAPDGLDILSKKSKDCLLRPEEKVLSVKKDESVPCAYGLKTVDRKDGKTPIELSKHLQLNCTQPVPPPGVRTSLLANPEWGSRHWCPPSSNSVRHLTTMQLLRKQGGQSCKARFKARELRPRMNTQKRALKEAKQENRPQTLETKVLPRPLLPSLTVSKVVIPVSTHRIL
ncbi:uncharacterized protein C16orf46 homolog [Saccopteryx bilineata]|uniref:uncharacterized protein C16orf46 homolog n=1 Tax=Saccopteryx bilineata TaxID=59482 RepID=UPI00338EC0BB